MDKATINTDIEHDIAVSISVEATFPTPPMLVSEEIAAFPHELEYKEHEDQAMDLVSRIVFARAAPHGSCRS
ncbi:MAG: hypothetical protein K9M17_05100 [Mariprofundaceae bacterium]|nr:hypothetical protein [Mariprofundaceae bacterium]